MGRFLILIALLITVTWTVDAFTVVGQTQTSVRRVNSDTLASSLSLNMADGQRDASRSGTKRDRLDKLAELEESRVDTDKGFVIKAAGAFVVLIGILLAVAFTTLEGPI